MLRTSIVEEDIRLVLETCHAELLALSGKTLLLTGGSGFVGSYLVESIISFNRAHDGAPCRLLLPTRSLEATRAKWPHFFDIKNVIWFEWDGLTLEPPSDTCNYIIHAASPTDTAVFMRNPYGTMHGIVKTTEQVLAYAKRMNVSALLFMSSGAIYGAQPATLEAVPETFLGGPDLTDTRSCYGEAKRYSELLCHLSGVPTVVARLFAFVGPHQDLTGSYAMTDFIRQAKQSGSIRIQSDGSALRTYCYASDLTNALWKLLLKGTPKETYNVGSDTPIVSILDLANIIAEIVGDVSIEVMKKNNSTGNNRSRYVPDITKLKKIFTPQISLTQGILRTIQSDLNILELEI
jgi:nucleoside-diphosphate-sugar epimerase